MSTIYLSRIRLTNFRTFGTFELPVAPSPGVVVIAGTNGLGKSSFFDAIEWCLTGNIRRFDPFKKKLSEAVYLTNDFAPENSHRVQLTYSTGDVVARGIGEEPDIAETIHLLKDPDWKQDVNNLSTYLGLTHFLGQSSHQRFTFRDPSDQWEALKGPSGVDRVEFIRERISGKSARIAFNRRVENANLRLTQLKERLAQWDRKVGTLRKLETIANVTGIPTGDDFNNSLDRLYAAAFAQNDPMERPLAPAECLEAIRNQLDERKRNAEERLTQLAYLSDRYKLSELVGPDNLKVEVETDLRELNSRIDASSATLRNATELEAGSEVAHKRAAQARDLVAERIQAVRQVIKDKQELASVERQVNAARLAVGAADLALRTADQKRTDIASKIEQQTATRARIRHLENQRVSAAQVMNDAGALVGLEAIVAKARGRKAELEQTAAGEIGRISELLVRRDTEAVLMAERRARVSSLREKWSSLNAAISVIAANITEDDLECPVCKTHFERGALAARTAAKATSSQLMDAEREVASSDATLANLNSEIERISALQSQLDSAASELATAELEVNERRRLLVMRLPGASPSAGAAELLETAARRLSSCMQEIAAVGISSQEVESELIALNQQRASFESQSEEARNRLQFLADQLLAKEAEIPSIRERISLRDISEDKTAEEELRDLEKVLALAASKVIQSETALSEARQRTNTVRSNHAQLTQQKSELNRRLAELSSVLSSLRQDWVNYGFEGEPSNVNVEIARSDAFRQVADCNSLLKQLNYLAEAYRTIESHKELTKLRGELQFEMGSDLSQLASHRAGLQESVTEAEADKEAAEQTQKAIYAIADDITNEAAGYSSQVLKPLNALIDRFKTALTVEPCGTVQFEAEHHRDRTAFAMKTNSAGAGPSEHVDPQLRLSEGQLAANALSILCTASVAYDWSRWRSLLLDDPLQHNDVTHGAAFMDLMRNMSRLEQYQIFMSTHDFAEAEYVFQKFDALGLAATLCELTAISKLGVVYDTRHNSRARQQLRN